MSGSIDRRDAERLGSIAVLCREFREAQDSGKLPSIEEYLMRVPAEEQRSLLLELVVLDLEVRRRAGEHPSLDHYICRFPQHAEFLRDRLSPGFDSADPSMGSTVSQAHGGNAGSILGFQHAELRPDATLGRYQLIERLGRGAFGEVWKARDPGLNRLVAVKTLRSDCAFTEAAVRAFVVEGQRLAQLRHPGIVGVYDVGAENGRVFIVSELVEGETLAARLSRDPAPMALREAVDLIVQVSEAVHYAHKHGIVHRDIKPSNILLDRNGRPLLADFGLAITEEDQLYEPAAAVGTLAYMSPEQFRGESHHADARADIYSLGVILYRLLTGRLPFVANSREQWRDQILHRAPRPPRTIDDSIPAGLEAVCLKCLSKDVEQRYTTAADLARALRDATSLPARPPGSRRPAAAVGVILCGATAALLIWMAANGLGPFRSQERSLTLPSNVRVPERVLWPAVNDGSAHSSITDDSHSVQMSCNDFALLAFEDFQGGDGELALEMSQNPWLGGVGVFWGFERPEPTADRVEFQALLVNRRFDETFELRRVIVPIRRDTGEPLNYVRVSSSPISKPSFGAHELRLQFREGMLKSVSWDGLEMPDLAVRPDDTVQGASDTSGRLGILVREASANFTNVRWNRKQLSFVESSPID